MRATGNLTLNDLIAHRAAVDGGRIGLIWEAADGRWSEHSFGELAERVAAVAGGLAEAGVRTGDRVVVHMGNRPEFVIAMFAASRLGAVVVPTIALYTPDELRYVLDHAEVRLVLCDPPRREVAEKAVASCETATPSLVCAGHQDELPTGQAPPVAPVSAADPAILMYSSGTTARPKGIVLSHEAMVLAGETNAQHQRLHPADRCLCVLPLFHVNAMCISMMANMVTGSMLVLAEVFDAARYWSQVRTYGITVGSLVANPIRQLLALPPAGTDGEHALRYVLYGMPLTGEQVDDFERRFRVRLINEWGMTEDGATGTRTPLYLPAPQLSIGLPMLGIDLDVFDENDRPVPAGGEGEARFVGGPRLDRYYRNEEVTAATNRDGRFCTGDTMRIDEKGFFYFTDRTKDVIKVKAENVASAEVERVLSEHEAVADAAVVGMPDERRDERIVAFVMFKAGRSATFEELREHCGTKLARFKVPHEVRVVDDMPRTSIGKIRKSELRLRHP